MANKQRLKIVEKSSDGSVIWYEGYIFKILNVRASYPHLDKPYAGEDGGEPKYGIVGLLDKKTQKAGILLLKKAIKQFQAENKYTCASDKLCLKDGNESGKEENNGMYTISARESKRPKVRDADSELVEGTYEILNLIYGGCYVDLMIKFWKQANKFGKRVNANLVSVRFREDGEAFGEGRIDDSALWDDEESLEEEDADQWGEEEL
ncbi:DNA binding protein [Aeromonas phage 13AC503A]|nr:DNA binding protein [Aeromonas phage 13AC503A]